MTNPANNQRGTTNAHGLAVPVRGGALPKGRKEAVMLQKLLNGEEAAALLGVSESSLNKWRGQGAGPQFVKIGSRVAYDQGDLEKFIAGRGRM
jgi:predicted DNA-binding transcriptional regulator AlpA